LAKELNQTRMRDSRLVALACVGIFFFTKPVFVQDTIPYDIVKFLGYMLVMIAAFGRVFTTVFLGGYKNEKLIKDGPFSMVRNPLYVLSFIGTMGVSFLSMRLGIIIIAPIATAVIYHYLVKREEAFLLETFGQEYQDYLNQVPRFIPDLKKYKSPEHIEATPDRILASLYDALWWVLIIPLFSLLQNFGY